MTQLLEVQAKALTNLSKSDYYLMRLLKSPNVWNRVEKWTIPEPNSGCLLWLGCLDTSGYAVMTGTYENRNRTPIRVARMVLTHKLGKLPTRALHICDVRCCVNENHLYEGTQQQNVRDMYNRGGRKIVRDRYGRIT
jgi:hypothetical protein